MQTKDKTLMPDAVIQQAEILDHASDFIELICKEAPVEYRQLLASEKFRNELQQAGAFNHGKLYVYAEFSVFRREFLRRFRDADADTEVGAGAGADAAASINAFCGLFLKNDISITNLVSFIEGTDDREQLYLNQPGK